MDAAWNAIMAWPRDPGFPIEVGSAMRIENYKLFEFLIRTSGDFADALEHVSRYSAVWTEGGVLTLLRKGQGGAIVYEHRGPAAPSGASSPRSSPSRGR